LTGVSRTEIDYQLGLLRPVHVHIHHMMGHSPVLVERIKARRLPIDWTIHDYHGICPRIHLNDKNGEYCGEPGEEGCNRCLKALGGYQGGPFAGDIKSWREDFAVQIQGARRVFVPSEDVARRLRRFITTENLVVRPHFEDLRGARPVSQFLTPGELVRVAVIGAIVNVKGSERLYACAADARARKLPLEFHVIGPTDRDREFRRLGNVRVLGPYRESEVFDHLERAQCHVAFLPSVWPETFMYTLSVAMSAGFWTMCFDLGAQADRLRAWGHGRVLRLSSTPAEINRGLLEAATNLGLSQAQSPSSLSKTYPQLLRDYYEFTAFDLKRMGVSSGEERQIPAPHLAPRTQPARRQ
jgi:glycosyltransferase involved in cell wall biosynthesis